MVVERFAALWWSRTALHWSAFTWYGWVPPKSIVSLANELRRHEPCTGRPPLTCRSAGVVELETF